MKKIIALLCSLFLLTATSCGSPMKYISENSSESNTEESIYNVDYTDFTEEEFKNNCKSVKYNELKNDKTAMSGDLVKVQGILSTIMDVSYYLYESEDSDETERINLKFNNERFSQLYKDGDSITVYGVSEGFDEYTSIGGIQCKFPSIEVYYMETTDSLEENSMSNSETINNEDSLFIDNFLIYGNDTENNKIDRNSFIELSSETYIASSGNEYIIVENADLSYNTIYFLNSNTNMSDNINTMSSDVINCWSRYLSKGTILSFYWSDENGDLIAMYDAINVLGTWQSPSKKMLWFSEEYQELYDKTNSDVILSTIFE